VTRPRVAAFTPGPPKRTGGAVYAGALLPALAEHLDVVAVSESPVEWDGPTVSPDDFSPDGHDVLVHFLADNPDHLFAYRSALRWGGVVVCHELFFPHLLGGSAPDDDALDLAEHLGAEGAAAVLRRRSRGVATHQEVYLLQVPGRPLRRAEAAVVHSRYARFVLEAEVPGLPVHHVPSHPGAVPAGLDDVPVPALRERLGLPADQFLVGLFGYLGGHKRVVESLRAVADAVPVARQRGVEIGVAMVGAEVAIDLEGTLAGLGLTGRAHVRHAPDDRAFFEHLAAVDAFVGLRYPTLGETSATMLQAMRLGKPVVTSDHAQFAEERAAVRVAPGEAEQAGVARAIVTLATCPHCHAVAAEASRTRAAACSLEATTAGYLDAIESVLRRRGAGRPRGAAKAPC
jgi:hypothetical protein